MTDIHSVNQAAGIDARLPWAAPQVDVQVTEDAEVGIGTQTDDTNFS
jgi:hypothetical protein